jgi:predicted transcriptional regulator
MEILVDISDEDLKALDEVAARIKVSRGALLSNAVSQFVSQASRGARSEAFGLWRNRTIDGLACQNEIRCEWRDKTP